MYLARVTGAIVASQKADRLRGQRLLTVSAMALDGTELGAPEQVALDPGLDAGAGDAVLVVKEGAVVADLLDRDQPAGSLPTPANVVIVAIVDDWTVGGVAHSAL